MNENRAAPLDTLPPGTRRRRSANHSRSPRVSSIGSGSLEHDDDAAGTQLVDKARDERSEPIGRRLIRAIRHVDRYEDRHLTRALIEEHEPQAAGDTRPQPHRAPAAEPPRRSRARHRPRHQTERSASPDSPPPRSPRRRESTHVKAGSDRHPEAVLRRHPLSSCQGEDRGRAEALSRVNRGRGPRS